MYGWRGRIGVIIPSSNTTMEAEFWKMAPEGISIHVSRVYLSTVDIDSLIALSREVSRASRELSSADVDIIVFGCTSGSLIGGVEWEKRLRDEIEKSSGVKSVTTAQAVVEALRTLNAREIAVATPYIDEINEREKIFLENHGFKVLRIKGLGIVKNTEIGRIPPWTAYRLGVEVSESLDIDALFISCTNFRTIEIIEMLESRLGVPVISSNTASMWLALRSIGVRDKIPYGRLLREY
ncbi:MAG: aspartate/glutamate racemase family protein [Sulfolobales archaeon]